MCHLSVDAEMTLHSINEGVSETMIRIVNPEGLRISYISVIPSRWHNLYLKLCFSVKVACFHGA